MRRSTARLASIVVLALAAALFATAALADNGNGKDNGNSANAPGQVKADQTPAQPQAETATPSNGQAKQDAKASSTAGVKPSNSTSHGTSCTTGGGTGSSATCTSTTSSNPDASKRYGNGKTAAQIANAYTSPPQTLSGPGNSQPHKLCVKHPNKSGGQDVHSAKHGISAACAPAQASVTSNISTESVQSVQSTQTAQSVTSTAAVTAQGQVLGELAPLAATKSHARGAVLGSIGRIAGSTLPFTGFPVWWAVLAGLMLIAAGAALRRRSA